MFAFVILYQKVTFKKIFHLWNDILFSADLIKATPAQTNPPNQQLHSEMCHMKVLIYLGHFIILKMSRILKLHLKLNGNNLLSCFLQEL